MLEFHELFHSETKKRKNIPLSDKDWPSSWREPWYKTYEGATRMNFEKLGARLLRTEYSLQDILLRRKTHRSFDGTHAMSVDELHTLLKLACGETEIVLDGGHGKKRRTYPSAGAMYPIEVYFILAKPPRGFVKGLYHYRVDTHEVELLIDFEADQIEHGIPVDLPMWANDAALIVFLTGVTTRIVSKYGSRGYRFLMIEAGHVAGNISLVAESLDLASAQIGAVNDGDIEELIDIDGISEVLLSVLAVGPK